MEKNSYERRVYNSVDERSLSSVLYVSKIDRKTIPVAKQESENNCFLRILNVISFKHKFQYTEHRKLESTVNKNTWIRAKIIQ